MGRLYIPSSIAFKEKISGIGKTIQTKYKANNKQKSILKTIKEFLYHNAIAIISVFVSALLYWETTKMSESNKESTKIALRAAVSADSSVSIAKESMTVSNRAYVYIQDFNAKLLSDSTVTTEYSIKNFGNSPAKDTHVTIGMSVIPTFTNKLGFYIDSLTRREFPLPPGKIIKYTPYTSSKISPDWMTKLKIGEAHLCVYGVIEYRDMFENKLDSYFCGEIIITKDKKQTFTVCPEFNKMR